MYLEKSNIDTGYARLLFERPYQHASCQQLLSLYLHLFICADAHRQPIKTTYFFFLPPLTLPLPFASGCTLMAMFLETRGSAISVMPCGMVTRCCL